MSARVRQSPVGYVIRGTKFTQYFHKGIILLRLEDETAKSKVRILSRLLENYPDRLQDAFIVVTEKQVRFAKSELKIH